MEHNFFIDIAGWVGAVSLLSAYGLVSTRRVAGDAFAYQLLNLAGGALLTINSFFYGAFPSVGVNVVWISIALFALARKRAQEESG